MHHHFRIGFRRETETVALGGLEVLEILDDAVVHDGHGIVADMGVGVGLARYAVGGPAGVGDADPAMRRTRRQRRFQGRDLAGRAHPLERPLIADHGHAGRIVTPVFQPPQALHQGGGDVFRCDGADDAAHNSVARDEGRVARGSVFHHSIIS